MKEHKPMKDDSALEAQEKKQKDVRELTDEEIDKVSGGARFQEWIRPGHKPPF